MAIFQKDSLMMQIKQLSNVLEQVIFKKNNGSFDEAQDILEESITELFENEKEIQQITLDDFLSALQTDGSFNPELALVVADLLYEEAELVDDPESCYRRALGLYQEAMKSPDTTLPLQLNQKISHIKDELEDADTE